MSYAMVISRFHTDDDRFWVLIFQLQPKNQIRYIAGIVSSESLFWLDLVSSNQDGGLRFQGV